MWEGSWVDLLFCVGAMYALLFLPMLIPLFCLQDGGCGMCCGWNVVVGIVRVTLMAALTEV